MVRCSDNSIYIGITTDIKRRIQQHNSESGGARYTRSRKPVKLVYVEQMDNRSSAAKQEYRLKQLSAEQKRSLISIYQQQLTS